MSSALAATVSKIKVPPQQSLLGIHPILVVYFQTDNAQSILSSLCSLSVVKVQELLDLIETTLQSSLYPKKQSVFMFNDPLVEVELLKSALIEKSDVAIQELASTFEIFSDTYPFIDTVAESSMLSENIQNRVVYENPEDKELVSEDTSYAIEKQAHSPNGLATFFIPTVAVGSLFVLSKLAREET